MPNLRTPEKFEAGMPGASPSWLRNRFPAFLACLAILIQLFAASLPMAPTDVTGAGPNGHAVICSIAQTHKPAPAHTPKSNDHKAIDCVVCQANQIGSAALAPEPAALFGRLIHSDEPVLPTSHHVVAPVFYRDQQPRAPPSIA